MSRLKDLSIAETEGIVTEEPVVEEQEGNTKSEAVLSKLGELVKKELEVVNKDIKELKAADKRINSNIDGLATAYAELKTSVDSVDSFDEKQRVTLQKYVNSAIDKAASEQVKKLQLELAGYSEQVKTVAEKFNEFEKAWALLSQLVNEIQGKQEGLSLRVEKLEEAPVPEPAPVVEESAPAEEAPAPVKEPEKPSLYERLYPKQKPPKEVLPFYVAIRADNGEEVINNEAPKDENGNLKDDGRIVESFERIVITKANNIEPGKHEAKEVYFWVDEDGNRLFRAPAKDVSRF